MFHTLDNRTVMLTPRFRNLEDKGWHAPEIEQYGPLTMMPIASCLHYATQCFEGMKVYRGYDGKLRLFRPDKNCARLNMIAARVALPEFDPVELEQLMKAFFKGHVRLWLMLKVINEALEHTKSWSLKK